MQRSYGRSHDEMRPLRITYNVFEYADGSVFYEVGKTKVLCAVTIQNGVPAFLRGQKSGWLKAHYSMLPNSTKSRIEREANQNKRNGRFIEISRLIGRSLRSVLNLNSIGEITITIDCDVLQADGSTRTACITAAYCALKMAEKKWKMAGYIQEGEQFLQEEIAAVSVGYQKEQVLLDPDFIEDSRGDADFNFIMTKTGNVIEVQGTSESQPISWDSVVNMHTIASKGIKQIFSFLAENMYSQEQKSSKKNRNKKDKLPLFSLAHRLKNKSFEKQD